MCINSPGPIGARNHRSDANIGISVGIFLTLDCINSIPLKFLETGLLIILTMYFEWKFPKISLLLISYMTCNCPQLNKYFVFAPLKVMSNILLIFCFFESKRVLLRLGKMFFISLEKPLSFLRYSSFGI